MEVLVTGPCGWYLHKGASVPGPCWYLHRGAIGIWSMLVSTQGGHRYLVHVGIYTGRPSVSGPCWYLHRGAIGIWSMLVSTQGGHRHLVYWHVRNIDNTCYTVPLSTFIPTILATQFLCLPLSRQYLLHSSSVYLYPVKSVSTYNSFPVAVLRIY